MEMEDIKLDDFENLPFMNSRKKKAGKRVKTAIGTALILAAGIGIGIGTTKINTLYDTIIQYLDNKSSEIAAKHITEKAKNELREIMDEEIKRAKQELEESEKKNQETINNDSNISPTVTKLASEYNLRYIVHCDKNSNTTRLYEISGKSIREIYKCRHTDGKGGPGPKQYSGDNKTIEEICNIKYVNLNPDRHGYGSAMIGLESGFPGMVMCGAVDSGIENAIRNGRDDSRSGLIYKNPAISHIANTISKFEDLTKIIIEDSRRPLALQ